MLAEDRCIEICQSVVTGGVSGVRDGDGGIFDSG